MIDTIQRWVASQIRRALSSEFNDIRLRLGQLAILASKSARPTFNNLWDAEVKVFSQWGEDGILDFLCDILGISKPKVLELGAGNFMECNSRFLAENRNASVVVVDDRSDLIASVKSQNIYWKNHLFALCEWITPQSVEKIFTFAREKIGEVEVLSLDIDGNDYWIMEKVDIRNCKIIVVEYNPLFGHKRAVSVPSNPSFNRSIEHFSWLYYGASLQAWIHLFKKSHFVFIGSNRAGNNAFFIQEDGINKLHFEIPRHFEMFTDWRVRESRNEEGKMSYLSGQDRVNIMKNLPLIDVISGSTTTVGEASE